MKDKTFEKYACHNEVRSELPSWKKKILDEIIKKNKSGKKKSFIGKPCNS